MPIRQLGSAAHAETSADPRRGTKARQMTRQQLELFQFDDIPRHRRCPARQATTAAMTQAARKQRSADTVACRAAQAAAFHPRRFSHGPPLTLRRCWHRARPAGGAAMMINNAASWRCRSNCRPGVQPRRHASLPPVCRCQDVVNASGSIKSVPAMRRSSRPLPCRSRRAGRRCRTWRALNRRCRMAG